MKGFLVKISGSYKTDGGDIIDYKGVEKTIPYVDRDVAKMHIISRLAHMWISTDEKYTKRVNNMREVYIDTMVEIENVEFDFIGKDVRDLEQEQLQLVALAYDLRRIPLYRSTSVRQMQEVAYVEYNNKVLEKRELNEKKEGFSFSDLPPVPLSADFVGARTQFETKDLQAEIDEAMGKKAKADKGAVSLEELKEIANGLNIKFHSNIGFNSLYEKIYGQTA